MALRVSAALRRQIVNGLSIHGVVALYARGADIVGHGFAGDCFHIGSKVEEFLALSVTIQTNRVANMADGEFQRGVFVATGEGGK